MYVSGLEISRAAAASHKVGKEKREPRDFKSEKRARSFVQKRFGVIFCSCSSNCIVMCIRIHGAEHTGGTFFKQESKCRQHLAFVNSSCELRAATTQFWLKNSHRHQCQVGYAVSNKIRLRFSMKLMGFKKVAIFCELTQHGTYKDPA